MKKLFIAVAIIFVSHIGYSQTADDGLKKDVLKLLDVEEGGTQEIDKMMGEFLDKIPKEKQAAFVVEFKEFVTSLKNKLADIYVKEFTADELKEYIAFYESPFWKKLSDKKGVLAEKSKEVKKDMIQEMIPLMMKYMDQ